MEPSVLDFLASLNKSFIDFSTEALPTYLGKIYAFHNVNYHRDIGNPESYLAAQIEFPQGLGACDRKNGWAAWCGKNTNILNSDFMEALALAYNADLINAERLHDDQMDNSFSSERTQIIHCQQMQNHVEEVMQLIVSGKLKKTNIIIYFKEVSRDFSSKSLFEKTQLRSLALYATGN